MNYSMIYPAHGPELEYCILSPIPCEWGGGAPYDINRFFAVQNYKSTADRAQLIRCPSPFPHPFFGGDFSAAVG